MTDEVLPNGEMAVSDQDAHVDSGDEEDAGDEEDTAGEDYYSTGINCYFWRRGGRW